MIYVPAGRTLYGSDEDEPTRDRHTHQPIHDIEVGAFLIARTEVTNGDYLAFLRTVPVSERRARSAGVKLSVEGRAMWLSLRKPFLLGEPYCDGFAPCVDWTRLPLDSVSREDSGHFLEWLSRSGRLPGARFCTDREWERAARGADDRRFSNGNGNPGPTDACTFATYGRDPDRMGPCAVGTHPVTRSPFGVDDMNGSVSEWTAGPADVAQPEHELSRGGTYYDDAPGVTIQNREIEGHGWRRFGFGLRVCADAK
jgi:formylglycine-generating enzyme required for sulfatase activity